MSEAFIQVTHLSAGYGDRLALDDVSLEICPGEVVALVGPNGAGKSTLLKSIARLVTPRGGTIRYATALGRDPRANIVYVPQRDQIDWTLPASVLDLVLMGAFRNTSRWRRIDRAIREKGLWALEQVGMAAHAGTQIGRLSGGQ